MKRHTSYKHYFLFLVVSLLGSCYTYYSFTDVHPSTYILERKRKGLLPNDSIPSSVISTLPSDFQLAYYSGHLWCFADWDGGIYVQKSKGLKQKAELSDSFRTQLNIAMNDTNFLVFTPIAYPNIYCVIPNEPIDTLMQETYFSGWLDYFDQWQEMEIEIQLLSDQREALLEKTFEAKENLKKLDETLKEYEKKIEELNVKIVKINRDINQRRQQIGLAPVSGADINPAMERIMARIGDDPRPPFELKIGYKLERDPFLEVVKRYCENVESREWATNEMQGGKYLNGALAQKMEEVYRKFENPELETDPELRAEIIDLKNRGFAGPRVTSGARTPLRQAHLKSEANKNPNPVGKYLGSAHLTGDACDIKLPNNGVGWEWNSPNHQKLKNTLGKMGLSMPVTKDKVHVQLAQTPVGMNIRRAAMVRGYHNVAVQLKSAQEPIKEDILFKTGLVAEQKARLEQEIANKQKEVEQQAGRYGKILAQWLDKLKELESLVAEILRREAEARRKAGEARRGEPREGGSKKSQFERPQPSPPRKEPQAERPRPQRREPRGRLENNGVISRPRL